MKIIKTAVTVLMTALLLIGCRSTEEKNSALVAEWTDTVNWSVRYILKRNGNMEFYDAYGKVRGGTYTVEGNMLRIRYYDGTEQEYTYSIGSNGYLKLDGGENGTYRKS